MNALTAHPQLFSTEAMPPPGGWTLDAASQALEAWLMAMPLGRDCSIHFEWGDKRWLLSSTLQDHYGERQTVRLRGFLGFLPFSAENRNAREQIVQTVRTVPHCSRGQLRIDKRGRLFFNDAIDVPDPVTPSSLLTAAVVMLLQARPIIEAIHPFLIGSDSDQPLPA